MTVRELTSFLNTISPEYQNFEIIIDSDSSPFYIPLTLKDVYVDPEVSKIYLSVEN